MGGGGPPHPGGEALTRILLPAGLALLLGFTGLPGCGGGGGGTRAGSDPGAEPEPGSFPLVDTGQATCYDDAGPIAAPAAGRPFHGQDAQYQGASPRYEDHGNGTVTDLVTGLTWQQDPGAKKTFAQAKAGASGFTLAGYDDWRLPSIKELYSLIDFRGVTGRDGASSTPYIDATCLVFTHGDATGERFIDAQMCSSTEYVGTTMDGAHTIFGVNFADGRIKGYGTTDPHGREKTFCVHHVRGLASYGRNLLVDNGDGTVTDEATGLMWLQADSGVFGAGDDGDGRLTWEQALAWAEGLDHAGHRDWRLPNAKELQGLVDYTRSPATHGTAAIDPLFACTPVVNEAGEADHGWYWTGTTHLDGPIPGERAVYVCFGRALGYVGGRWTDVHGAGAQRSDPKRGNPADYPFRRCQVISCRACDIPDLRRRVVSQGRRQFT